MDNVQQHSLQDSEEQSDDVGNHGLFLKKNVVCSLFLEETIALRIDDVLEWRVSVSTVNRE